MLKVGQKVRVIKTGVEGVISIIDKQHPNTAVRIQITKGNTPITDYFANDLALIE